jgi:hypothetical protein
LLARVIGIGVRPEHIQTAPAASVAAPAESGEPAGL